jgi:lipoprotein-anchoring transpeptidase ErfK/SrfK
MRLGIVFATTLALTLIIVAAPLVYSQEHIIGGPDNPLGARAVYLGDTLYRIHGTNEYDTIGTGVSSGCFRMTNDDVIDLYNRVRLGATVIVQ